MTETQIEYVYFNSIVRCFVLKRVQDYVARAFEDVKSDLQASDTEFEAGLKDKHILILNKELRPMSLEYLNAVLELLLNILVSSSYSLDSAPALEIAEMLQCDHEVPQDVSIQVMAWFGELSDVSISDRSWKVNITSIIRQLGIGILSLHRASLLSIPCVFIFHDL